MDAGQITQGLRADCLQQNSNGAATAQFSGSGASFADIMGVIIANVQNGQNAENILDMQNFIGGQNMEILQNILNTQDMSYLKNILNMTDLFAIQNKLALNIQNTTNFEMENIFAGLNEINTEIQDENQTEIQGEIKTETQGENTSDIQIEDKPDISDDNISEPQGENDSDVENAENVENENNVEAPIKNEEIKAEEKTDLKHTAKPDNSIPDKILTVENKELPEQPRETAGKAQNNERPAVKNPYEPYLKEDEQVNANRFNLRDINIVSEKFSLNKSKTEKPDNDLLKMNAQKIDKNIKLNKTDRVDLVKENVHYDNGLTQKLTDIFGIITPELMNNDQRNRKDSFDFSESVIKADPLQLAGLLDFISTGIGIPQAMDISDSQLFKNVSADENMEKVSERVLFDPEDMIKSGEMEILSYTPAEAKQKPVLTQPQDMPETDEKTIDFARTMKSVRENVKPIISDDDDDEIKTNVPVMTAEDMNHTAKKIDISFDRAYAELELNKTKYGSADKQLLKGISENLQKGRSEFTVKLRPEGLGEILVKLVSEDGGKAVLSMVASSEKTAQLLNRDLASLQSSLNQHNVEIENNSVKTLETVTATQSAFNQYDERRQDEANQQNQFRRIRKKLGNISVGNVSYDNESEPVNANAIDSALNITI